MNRLTDHLRERTNQVHRRIEHSSWSQSLLSPDMQLSGYLSWLRSFHTFLASCEFQITRSGILAGEQISFIDRSVLLAKDLEQLGYHSKPDYHFLKDINAWSCLYVIEGSQMGGMVLFRRLHANHNIPSNALNYFGYKLRQRPQRWLSIKSLINEVCCISQEELASDAIACFERLEILMQESTLISI